MKRLTSLSLLTLLLLLPGPSALAQTPATSTTPAPDKPSKFISPDDGWLDLSGFLDTRFGFLPVGTVITEPAVGLGAAAGLAFINKPAIANARPDITLLGGFGTDNGSKGALAGDLHHWFGGRLQTVAAVVWASVNLDYYGCLLYTSPSPRDS